MKKRLTACLAGLALVVSLAGCGGTAVDKTGDAGQDLTLKMVFGGVGKMSDSDRVWETFNQKLGDYLPHTQVEFEVIPFSDYAEKWRLMAAAKETVDVAWAGYVLDFNEETQKGSYLDMTDLIDKYAPDMKAELPDWLFDLGKVNGKVYCIPNYQMMVTLPQGTRVHSELAKKYGLDEAEITRRFSENRVRTREDLQPFEDYLAALAANGDLRKGVSPTFIESIVRKLGMPESLETIVANAAINYEEDGFHVYNTLTDFPGNDVSYEVLNDWYNKGYIRKDMMALQDQRQDEGKEDGYVMWVHQALKGSAESETQKYGFPIDVIPMNQKLFVPSGKSTTNLVIPATAQNPARSMGLIDLLNTKKGAELYNLLVYGLEGVHYEKVSDTRINWLEKSAPGNSKDNHYGYQNWALGNTFHSYETQYNPEGWLEYLEKDVNDKALKSPLMGFSLDTKPIKLELAQYNTVIREYKYLETISSNDYQSLLQERNEKLKNAGSEKIVQEVQRQINQWLAEGNGGK